MDNPIQSTDFVGTVFDRCSFGATKREKTPEGFLIVHDNKFAKPGIMKYLGREVGDADPNRIVKVYRSPEELFREDTIKSFRSKPMAVQHHGLLDSVNTQLVSVGFSKDDVRPEEGYLTGSIVVTDAKAIESIESGQTEEISLGYQAKFSPVSGTTPDGETFEYQMSNIRGNHIALVPRGRNGRDCRVADEAPTLKGKQAMEPEMTTLVLDGVSYTMPVQVAQVVGKLQRELDKVESAQNKVAEDHATALAAVTTERDQTKARLDATEADRKTEDQLDVLVEQRLQLVEKARTVVADYDASGKSAEAVFTEVCTKKGVDCTGKSAEYIQARFDVLAEDAEKSATKNAIVGDGAPKTGSTRKSWRELRHERTTGGAK